MHFSTVATTAALVGSAMAGTYYESSADYHTVTKDYETKVYTSVSTCTEKTATSTPIYYAPTTTSAPVYKPTSSAYPVTYTSYEHVTVTSCADYVKSCPAKTYTSTAISVSTCTGEYGHSSTPVSVPVYSVPYYQPPSNTSTPIYYAPPTSVPVYAPSSSASTYTNTYYTTVCPGKDYCYGTTITSTYCPSSTPAVYVPTSKPVVPVYTTASVPAAYPTKNATATYSQPPQYTGAASSNVVSFGVAAIAGLAALIMA